MTQRTVIDGVDFTDQLRADEVAALFRVDRKTATRWASMGYLASIKTPGGHYRFSRAQVMELLHTGEFHRYYQHRAAGADR